MEIRNLITFTKVAETGSLSGAAKDLGYAQSTVTAQMQQLEKEMGVALYERIGKKIRITQEGQELLAYARSIIRISREALQIGKGSFGKLEGTLRLGIVDTLQDMDFMEQLNTYAERYPDVRLEVCGEKDTHALVSRLLRNEIDLMITLDHLLSDPSLITAVKERQDFHFTAHPSHALASGRKLKLEQILQYPLIRADSRLAWEQELDLAAIGAVQTPILVPDARLAVQLAAQGRGIALAPDRLVRRQLEQKILTILDYQFPGQGLWKQTLYHKNKWMTGEMKAWIQMTEETKDEQSGEEAEAL